MVEHAEDAPRELGGDTSPRGSDEAGATMRDLLAPDLRGASLAVWAIVGLAAFEGLAVAAALPDVAGDLGSVSLLPWVITAYLLTSGVATVVAGPLVDSLGVRRVFRVGVVVFTAAGSLAAVVPTMEAMIGLRVAQGVGAGLVNAVALSAVALVYPPRLVGRAFAANSTIWGVMGVAGPGLAAILLTVASWRWIFGINLPLGLLALVLGWRAFPGPAGAREQGLDPRGTALVTVFTLALLLAVDAIALASLGWLALAVGALAAYRWHTHHHARPVLGWRHVASSPFGVLGWSIASLLFGAIGAQSYLPLYVRAGRGGGSVVTAWSVLFFTLGWTLGANLSSRLLDRMREVDVVLRGFVLSASSLGVVAALVFLDAPLWTIFAAFLVGGLGTGMATNAGLTLLRSVSDDAEIGRATAAHQFLRNQGFTMGAAMGGAALLLVVGSVTGDVEAVRELLSSGGEGASDTAQVDVDGETAAAVADGYGTAVAIGAVAAGLGAIPLRRLRRDVADAEDRATEPAAAD